MPGSSELCQERPGARRSYSYAEEAGKYAEKATKVKGGLAEISGNSLIHQVSNDLVELFNQRQIISSRMVDLTTYLRQFDHQVSSALLGGRMINKQYRLL